MTVQVAGAPGSGASTLARSLAAADVAADVAADLPGGRGTCTLIVLEPNAVAGSLEQQLLTEAANQDGPIALVCNKIDLYWDWPAILRRSRQYLDPDHRLPVFAVSATTGAGCADLVEWIVDGPGPHRWTAPPVGAPTPPDDHPVRATGRAERLNAVRVGVSQERAVVLSAVSEGLREISASATSAPASVSRSQVVSSVEDAVTELLHRTESSLAYRLAAVDRVALAGVAATPAQLARQPLTVPPLPDPPHRRGGGESALVLVFGASVGLGIGRLAMTGLHELTTLGGALSLTPWVTMVVAMCCGVAVASWAVMVRTRASGRAALDSWVGQTLAAVRGRVESEVTARALAAESVISTRVNRYFQR